MVVVLETSTEAITIKNLKLVQKHGMSIKFLIRVECYMSLGSFAEGCSMIIVLKTMAETFTIKNLKLTPECGVSV